MPGLTAIGLLLLLTLGAGLLFFSESGPSTIKALIKAFGVDAYRAKFDN